MRKIKVTRNNFIIAEWNAHFFFDLLPTLCFTRSKYYNYTEYGVCIAFLVFDWVFQIQVFKK